MLIWATGMGFSKVGWDVKTTLQTGRKSPQDPDPVCNRARGSEWNPHERSPQDWSKLIISTSHYCEMFNEVTYVKAMWKVEHSVTIQMLVIICFSSHHDQISILQRIMYVHLL